MVGRQKCPMSTVAAATRDGKPALGQQGGRMSGEGVPARDLGTNKPGG